MIVGLTHDQNHQRIKKLAVSFKVSIGLPKDLKVGRKAPKKLDHFFFARKNTEGEWIEDKELNEFLGQKYGTPLQEFDVIFLDDDIENVFKTQMAWWSASKLKCRGDGEVGYRLGEIIPADERSRYPELENSTHTTWTPCASGGCPDVGGQGGCGPTGQLFFILADRPNLGSVGAYYSGGYQTVRQISSSLQDVVDATRGPLKGIRLKMCMKPGRTTFQDSKGETRVGSAYFVHIEFRAEDYKRMMAKVMSESLFLDRQAASLKREIRLIGSGSTIEEEIPPVEQLSETEEAQVMGPEFFPDSQEVPAQPEAQEVDKDEEQFMGLLVQLQVSEAEKSLILSKFGGDFSTSLAFLARFTKIAIALKPEKEDLLKLLQDAVSDPDAFFSSMEKAAETAKPKTEKSKQPAKKAAAAKAGSKTNGKAATPPSDAKPAEKGKWGDF